jgi:hypothetical protein
LAFACVACAADPGVMVAGHADRVEQFAAAELARYLTRIGGDTVPLGEAGAGHTLFVGLEAPGLKRRPAQRASGALAGLDADSFLLRTVPGGLLLAGASPRGTLYAVYAYLEELGVRWYHPGEAFELVPRGPIGLAGYDRLESPDFPDRCLTLAYQRIDDYVAWIDFAAKQRLNTVFFHDYGGWWAGQRERLWPEMQRRGLELQLGGHYLYGFRSEELFERHPEWFREQDGRRTPESNLCVSSRDGLAHWTSQAVSLVREKMMEADSFHIWPDDGGAWCQCSHCRELSPADQSLILGNAFANGIRQLKPRARVAFLAYGETMTPAPAKAKPAPGVFLLLAPRARCYGHALTDPTCEKNLQFREAMEAQIAALPGADVEVFEYYTDQVRFPTIPNLARIIPADLRYYRRIGARNVGPLTVKLIGFRALPVNLLVYARCEWDLDADPRALIADLCRRYFGGTQMVSYYEALADAYGRFVPYFHFEGTELELVDVYDRAYEALAGARSRAAEPYRSRIEAQEGDVGILLGEHASAWNLRASGWGAKKDQPHEVSAMVPLDLQSTASQTITFECPGAATYRARVWCVRGPRRRTVHLRVDGEKLVDLPLHARDRAPVMRDLGQVRLTAGEHAFAAHRPVPAEPFSAGVALLRLTPVEEP